MNSTDVLEFLVAGATAVQLGTVHFIKPRIVLEVLEELEAAVVEEGLSSIRDLVGTLEVERRAIAARCDG